MLQMPDSFWPLWSDISFRYPWVLLALMSIPFFIAWYWQKGQFEKPYLQVSSLAWTKTIKTSPTVWLVHLLFLLRMLVLALLIAALARPQSSVSWQNIESEAVDIIMCLDVSSSMLAKDFKPNRLAAAREIGKEFIEGRPGDRIGLVLFAGESFTQCPLTFDHQMLSELLLQFDAELMGDGTAIGSGLATSVARLRDSEAKSKVVILLTDGVNNKGSIAPITAAELAKSYGIRVYTVGIGTKGKALSPVAIYPNGEYEYAYVDVEIDEETMKKISDMTNGSYFRAVDNQSLRSIYREIEQLEKTKIKVNELSRKTDEFWIFVLPALLLLATEWLLSNTFFRSIP